MSHRKTLYRSVILQKSLWTILFIVLYLIGMHLDLPFIPSNMDYQSNDIFTNYMLQMFGAYRRYSIFSLGLGPWMTATLIVMIFRFLKWFGVHRLSLREINWLQYGLVLIVGFWQSESIVNSLMLSRVVMQSESLTKLCLRLVLVAGTFLLIWIATRNGENGFGGALIIVIVNVVLMLLRTAIQLVFLQLSALIYLLITLAIVVFVAIHILISRSEYRMPVNRLLVHNEFQQSYIAMKLNAAGGMPFMLGMTAVFFVGQLLLLLNRLFSGNTIFLSLYNGLSIYSLSGALFYTVILVVLTYAFTFIHVDPVKIAQSMQKSGDYIDGIRPGMPTKQFLEKRVKLFATVGACYIALFLGVPNIVAVFYVPFRPYAMIPGTLLLVSGVVMSVYDQIKLLTLGKTYRANIFEEL